MTTNHPKGDAWDAVIHLLNMAIQIEYAFIVNYPRLIDHLVSIDGIKDEQLSKDLEHLGKDSTKHLGLIGQIIVALGGGPDWQINTIDPMTHVEDVLNTQIDREKKALSLYEEVRDVARQNGGKRRERIS